MSSPKPRSSQGPLSLWEDVIISPPDETSRDQLAEEDISLAPCYKEEPSVAPANPLISSGSPASFPPPLYYAHPHFTSSQTYHHLWRHLLRPPCPEPLHLKKLQRQIRIAVHNMSLSVDLVNLQHSTLPSPTYLAVSLMQIIHPCV